MELKPYCHFCGKTINLEEHHIFFGTSNRKNSEKYGLKVNLCPVCHRDNVVGVHGSRQRDLILKRQAQEHFEKEYTREEFMRIFGRNYL